MEVESYLISTKSANYFLKSEKVSNKFYHKTLKSI